MRGSTRGWFSCIAVFPIAMFVLENSQFSLSRYVKLLFWRVFTSNYYSVSVCRSHSRFVRLSLSCLLYFSTTRPFTLIYFFAMTSFLCSSFGWWRVSRENSASLSALFGIINFVWFADSLTMTTFHYHKWYIDENNEDSELTKILDTLVDGQWVFFLWIFSKHTF